MFHVKRNDVSQRLWAKRKLKAEARALRESARVIDPSKPKAVASKAKLTRSAYQTEMNLRK